MALSNDRKIWTWFEGEWHEGNLPILGSADHATWLGTLVFDGARLFEGVFPDLDLHCARVLDSAKALGMRPTTTAEEILALAKEGIGKFDDDAELYIRPMIWSTRGEGSTMVDPDPDSCAFALCLEEATMAEPVGITITTTSFIRPSLESATVNAKAACLYPNSGRMLQEAAAKGFGNAIVCDALGNVVETATANIFMVKDGEYLTPIPNGTFLNGITRQRVMKLLREQGETVREVVLKIEDFRNADEIFITGNYPKVMPVIAFDEQKYEYGPKGQLARKLYWDWAHSE